MTLAFESGFRNKGAWFEVSIYQIIIFVVWLISTVVLFLLVRIEDKAHRKRIFNFSIFFGIFNCMKIAGGIISCIVLKQEKTPSIGMIIAIFICDNIGLGLLIKCCYPFVEYVFIEGLIQDQQKDKLSSPKRAIIIIDKIITKMPIIDKAFRSDSGIFSFLTAIVAAGIITSIISSSMIGSTNPESLLNYKTLVKVSASLYFVSVCIMAFLLVYILIQKPIVLENLLTQLVAVSLLLIVRAIYGLLTASTGGLQSYNKYLLLYGEYAYYTFLALVEESVICLIFGLINFTFAHTYRKRMLENMKMTD